MSTPMPFAARALLGLFAALPAALVAASLLQLAPPPGLPALAQRPLWTAWALIGGWLALAATLAGVRRAVTLWRAALGTLAALLLLGAAGSLLGRLPLGGPMAVSLALLAAATLALAGFIDERRVRAERPAAGPDARGARDPSHRPGAAGEGRGAPSRWTRLRRHLVRHAGFWLCAGLMLESFRLAFGASADPQRGVGMLGMLLVFFVVLPAVSLAGWLPRTASGLLMAAALGFGALAWRSSLPLPLLAALLLPALAALTARHRGVPPPRAAAPPPLQTEGSA